MDGQIKACKTKDNAKKIAKDFIQREIRDYDSINSARDKIKAFMNARFPYFSWIVTVYEPHSGFEKHTTNADVIEFRYVNSIHYMSTTK